MAYGTAEVLMLIWYFGKINICQTMTNVIEIQPPDQDKSNCGCKSNPPDVTFIWSLDIWAPSLH